MPRIKGVPAGHAGPSVKIAYRFTRRHFARLTGRKHFGEARLAQLTFPIALENMRDRFNAALGIGAAGFSQGMACPRPVPAGEIA